MRKSSDQRNLPHRGMRRATLAALSAVAWASGCAPSNTTGKQPTFFGKTDQPSQGGVISRIAQPPPDNTIDAGKVPARDDVIGIAQYWPQNPWLVDDIDVLGFRVPVVFISAETQKGTFVEGVITVRLFEVLRGRDDRLQRKLLHEWVLGPGESRDFRVRKLSTLGYYYGFVLQWPRELHMTGRTVAVEFSYESTAGRVVREAPRRMQVPLSSAEVQLANARRFGGLRDVSGQDLPGRAVVGEIEPLGEVVDVGPRAAAPAAASQDTRAAPTVEQPTPRPPVRRGPRLPPVEVRVPLRGGAEPPPSGADDRP